MIPSSMTTEPKTKHLAFEDVMAPFGSILSVLPAFMIEGRGSLINKPFPHKLIYSIPTAVAERQARKRCILVKSVPEDCDIDSHMNRCSMTTEPRPSIWFFKNFMAPFGSILSVT